jgi:hypothetical protein
LRARRTSASATKQIAATTIASTRNIDRAGGALPLSIISLVEGIAGLQQTARGNPLLRLPAVGDNAAMQIEPPKADSPKRKRRWSQFSLRSLMVLTLICAVASAWVARKIERKRKEREAVDAIVKLGGAVGFDYQRVDYGAKPPGPVWLRTLLGENFFCEVSDVQVGGPEVTDADIINLKRFTELKSLCLPEARVSDAGLVNIKGFTKLECLGLGWTNVTDVGLVNLKGLAKLKVLNLSASKVTHAGVEDLQKALPSCKIYCW